MTKKKLRAYSVMPYDDSEWSEAVIAETAKEAKKIAWDRGEFIQEVATDDEGWIGVRVSWLRKSYVEGLEKGIVEVGSDALRREMFVWVDGITCPICKDKDCVVRLNEFTDGMRFVSCGKCEEKYTDDKASITIPKEAIPYRDLNND